MVNRKQAAHYPLRLPVSLKAEVERWATQEGISMNQFIASAVAEKIASLATAKFFEERRHRADFPAFERILSRAGGEPPQPGDEVDPGSP